MLLEKYPCILTLPTRLKLPPPCHHRTVSTSAANRQKCRSTWWNLASVGLMVLSKSAHYRGLTEFCQQQKMPPSNCRSMSCRRIRLSDTVPSENTLVLLSPRGGPQILIRRFFGTPYSVK